MGQTNREITLSENNVNKINELQNSPWRFNLALLLFLVSVTRNEKLNWEIYSLKNGLGLHQYSIIHLYSISRSHTDTNTQFYLNFLKPGFWETMFKKISFFSSFSFHFLICESIITHLQRRGKYRTRLHT